MKKLFLLSMLALSIFLGQSVTEPTTTYAADCYAAQMNMAMFTGLMMTVSKFIAWTFTAE